MPEPSLAELVWSDLTQQVNEIKARVSTLEARTERSETTSGHPNYDSASAPLAANGAKRGDEVWLNDATKPGESVGSGVLAYYDSNTDTWIPFGLYPRRYESWHMNSLVLSGNQLQLLIDAAQIYNGAARQNPAADGDSFTHGFLLMAGVYTFTAIFITSNDSGIIDWYLDNIFIGSDDIYSAVGTLNVFATHTVTVLLTGYHVLKGVINGKNAASAAFNARITSLSILPSAD